MVLLNVVEVDLARLLSCSFFIMLDAGGGGRGAEGKVGQEDGLRPINQENGE
jgi:hypothetical protein